MVRQFFHKPLKRIVGAAGRLSPEKGFEQLIEAARMVTAQDADAGFVLFGDGPLRAALSRQIAASNLAERFILAGFRADLGKFLPHLDLMVLSSYTEGLPVVLLEALAAGVPVVSTAVGGVRRSSRRAGAATSFPPAIRRRSRGASLMCLAPMRNAARWALTDGAASRSISPSLLRASPISDSLTN